MISTDTYVIVGTKSLWTEINTYGLVVATAVTFFNLCFLFVFYRFINIHKKELSTFGLY